MLSRLTLPLTLGLGVILALAALASPPSSGALAPQPQAFSLGLVRAFNNYQFASPVFVTHAGDGTNRLFVVERQGRIRVAVNGVVQGTPFLDIAASIVSTGTEQGLLGLAFHPRYPADPRFFVFYTAAGDGANTLAAYRVSATNPNVAESGPGQVLLPIADRFENHNGGMLAFGPDNYLYVGTGDGGSGGDPDNNAQNLQSLLGKLLRLDVDTAVPYAIPTTNPITDSANGRREIWAYGLRNPWRWSFDRATGDLYIGDVGQNVWEEIDRQPAGQGGLNYGWRIMEGLHCYNATTCNMAGITLPIHEYAHSAGTCSVTGGYVYRGPSLVALQGAYLFADFCTGQIWSLRPGSGGAWTVTPLLDTTYNISSFGEDESGEMYLADLNGGVYRLVDANTLPTATPTRTATATPTRTSTPTPTPSSTPLPAGCTPRPNVRLELTNPEPGRLRVTVHAPAVPGVPTNTLRSLQFGTADNAVVTTLGGTTGSTGNFTMTPPAGATQHTFDVLRSVAGRAVTVPFTANDVCGPWPTFAGGGPTAF